MMDSSFIHLRLHTEYSLVDGLITLKPLLKKTVNKGMSAVALTDFNNLFGCVKFYKEATSKGVKPIIGADILVRHPEDSQHAYLLTCLCQNQKGYHHLTQLISKSYVEQHHLNKTPEVLSTWLEDHHEGLIVLSGERQGDIGEALMKQDDALAQKRLDFWCKLFPDRFYIELQRNGRKHQNEYLESAYHLAMKQGVPLVATNDVRFLNIEDYEAHEARVCIQQGVLLASPSRPRLYSEHQYFKSQSEMIDLFSDLPEALQNTVEIAKRCTLELKLGKVFFPIFPTPNGLSTEEYCTTLAQEGLNQRFEEITLKDQSQGQISRLMYEERLAHELEVINTMGFAAYFLIVSDFIAWAKQNGIPVGPGRGSGAGSLVAYALNITDIDPLPYKLLFERFLNPERISLPDFDIDFCMMGRDQVIDYVSEKYGRDCVAQIITFGTMAAKAVVRDVGRILAYPYGFVDKIAKLIPFEIGITLKKALQQEEILRERYEKEEEVQILMDLAQKLEGIARNAGKHAGGVVIAPSSLTDFTALFCADKSMVTQFDKSDVESVGLVKFDFLGLRTLTIIDWAVKIINEKLKTENKPLIDIRLLPLNDPKTYELFEKGDMTAVFQVESSGMRKLVLRLKPDCFEDIMALVALYRPGPLQSGMVDDFVDRKHGRAAIQYPHEALEPILKSTYGVILYQEQVMQIAQVLAGYTLGGADLLRSAMGKKKPEEMARQRTVFMKGAVDHGVDATTAQTIFDLMEKFAGYGFNKSHSAAYALISYQTAWLKVHYPSEYMAAVLSSDMDNTDKMVTFIYECKRMKIEILPPDINQSHYYFTVPSKGKIRYGLGAIKGVGEAIVETITHIREKGPKFIDFFDFLKRMPYKKLNRRALESFIRSGTFDSLHACRATLLHNVEHGLHQAEQIHKNAMQKQQDLFAQFESYDQGGLEYQSAPAMTESERLQGEKNTLGFYISGHPLERYTSEFQALKVIPLSKIDVNEHKSLRTAGLLTFHRSILTKSNVKMGVITIEDQEGKIDVTLFKDIYREVAHKLQKDEIVVIEGEVSIDEFNQQPNMIARKLFTLSELFSSYAQTLILELSSEDFEKITPHQLFEVLKEYQGGNTVLKMLYHTSKEAINLLAGEKWKLKLNSTLLQKLEEILGVHKVSIVFQ